MKRSEVFARTQAHNAPYVEASKTALLSLEACLASARSGPSDASIESLPDPRRTAHSHRRAVAFLAALWRRFVGPVVKADAVETS